LQLKTIWNLHLKRLFIQIIIFLIVLLPSEIVLASDFLIDPYLRKITSSSADIAWEFSEPRVCYFYYGPIREKLEHKIKLPVADYHLVELDNLEPDTMYYYLVEFEEVSSPEGDFAHFFRTIGSGRRPFTFAVLGDSSCGKDGFDLEHQRVINSIMNYTYPEFLIMTGDLVMDGRKKEDWVSFFQVEREIIRNTPIYASRGNNEEYGSEYFNKYFRKKEESLWYSFDYAGCHFISLDILKGQGQAYYNSFRPGEEQFSWLLSDLQSEANINADFTFVFFHAPVFPPHGDTSEILEELLHPVFSKYGVDMVFNGTHTYSRAEKDGVIYYISGGGGAELYRNPILDRYEIKEVEYLLHHLRVNVNYPVITVEAIDTNNNVFSTYRYWDPEADQMDKGSSAISLQDIELNKKEAEDLVREGISQESLSIVVFSLPNCSYCDILLNRTLPNLERKMGIDLNIKYLRLDQADNFEKMVYIEELLNDRDNELPAVLVGREILGGEKEIKSNLETLINKYVIDNSQTIGAGDIQVASRPLIEEKIRERFASMKILPILLAGLLDGINPCAFTVIVFLLSYLIYIGKNKNEILLAGIAFTIGVFITYILVGFGLSKLLSSIAIYNYIARGIKYSVLILVVFLGCGSLYDFYLCRKDKEKDISLQLPKFLKIKIHDHIRIRVKSPHLIIASLVLGFFVSVFELACTGQIYVPTIIYMLKVSTERIRAFGYLMLYNLAFVTPLIVIFVAAYFGLNEKLVKRFMQENIAMVKLATALLFFVLAILLV